MKQFLEEVLEEIRLPERDEKKIRLVFREIRKELLKKLPEAEPFLGGSAAKRTMLRQNKELDIFLRFRPGTNKISEKTIEALKKYDPEIVKGSRDYASFQYEGFKIEVIPVYKITSTEQAENIMDCSSFHVEYVKKNLKEPEQAMLLKYFCKQNGIYGAETYKKAFSGYALELLTIHYKTFENVVRNASKWKKGLVLTGSTDKLTKSQKTSLMIMDPVQENRNASNALSDKNFEKFVELSKKYVKKPSKNFFLNNDTLELMKKETGKSYAFYPQKFVITGKKDIFLSKLDKKLGRISAELSELGFKNDYGIIPEESVFFLRVKKRIPKTRIHEGPGTSMKQHCASFKRRWGDSVRVKDNKLYVEVERDLTDGLLAVKKLVRALF